MILIFFLHFCIYSFIQGGVRTERFIDYVDWTPWKTAFDFFLEGFVYFIPGIILWAIPQLIFLKSNEKKKDLPKFIEITLTIISLSGILLAIYGGFHFIFLLANFEYVLWAIIFFGIFIIFMILLISWIYGLIKNSYKLNK